ncbi:MAG: phenylalanine 4-monooxygenase, partial [Candidatus Zixiibacteriota bacterium]
DIWKELKNKHSQDWLLPVEILEILIKENIYPDLQKDIKQYLQKTALKEKKLAKLINDGVNLINNGNYN